MLSDEHAAERARALGITAAVLAHRGLLSRAAELYRAAGPAAGADYPMIAVPVLAGIGAIGEARQVLTAADGQVESAPTLLSGVESLMARGIDETISGSPVTALSQLTRAATLLESTGSTPLLPDTPAALAALVAMHAGEFGAAHSVLRRAMSAGLGGKAFTTRHTLLLAFLATMRGHTKDAHTLLASAGVGRLPLEPRDELFAAAAAWAWPGVKAIWLRCGAAGLGHVRRCSATRSTCTYCCHLASWRSPRPGCRSSGGSSRTCSRRRCCWRDSASPSCGGCRCTGTACTPRSAGESPEEARRHVSALAELAAAGPYAAVLAGAAACWMRVLAGTADVDAVVATARQLGRGGLRRGGRPAGGTGCDPRHRPQGHDHPAGMRPRAAAGRLRASWARGTGAGGGTGRPG